MFKYKSKTAYLSRRFAISAVLVTYSSFIPGQRMFNPITGIKLYNQTKPIRNNTDEGI